MKLLIWLAQAVPVNGKRNPHETVFEIFDGTVRFIKEVQFHQRRRVLADKLVKERMID